MFTGRYLGQLQYGNGRNLCLVKRLTENSFLKNVWSITCRMALNLREEAWLGRISVKGRFTGLQFVTERLQQQLLLRWYIRKGYAINIGCRRVTCWSTLNLCRKQHGLFCARGKDCCCDCYLLYFCR